MTLTDYIEYTKSPHAEAKARVVVLLPGEGWTDLRRFCQERGDYVLRLSDLLRESAWVPMPDEVFSLVNSAMQSSTIGRNAVVLLGFSGYLSLLSHENKRAAVDALRKWVDSISGQEAVCLLRNDDETISLLKKVFNNPRYNQGYQLLQFDGVSGTCEDPLHSQPDVMLVRKDFVPLLSENCESFQRYLWHSEDLPNDNSTRRWRIAVTSSGQKLPGLNPSIQQVVTLREFAHVFYDVEGAEISESALRWMCERGKEGDSQTLEGTLKAFFFAGEVVEKSVLRVFDSLDLAGHTREALLWLVKRIAPQGSYLSRVVKQAGVVVGNFRSAYVTGAAEWLYESKKHADERRDAIQDANATRSDTDIRQFIARCADQPTSLVAPWLNCETNAEREELLRRCATDRIVSNAVKAVYPEVEMYLNQDTVYGDKTLEDYFIEYRQQKIAGHVTAEFYAKSAKIVPPASVKWRNEIVQLYASDRGCALLVVDGMGAEWLPMLVAVARQRNIGIDSVAVGKVRLPTSTQFNDIHWPDPTRRLQDIKRLDNIAHNGVEAHVVRRVEENLAAALDVIGNDLLPRVAYELTRFERILVTADHGSSRLAALAWRSSEQRLANTLPCEEGAVITDWRYREKGVQGKCPSELEESLDGMYWVVRGYDRLPKKGGGQGFELHGGATLEERLAPVVVFSRNGLYVPTPKPAGKPAQIIEKDDFDL